MNVSEPSAPFAGMSALHWLILALLVFTAVTYAARTLLFRSKVKELLGFFDVMGEIGHSGCALLMMPMVVPTLMSDGQVRLWSALLSLMGGLFFTGEGVLVQMGVVTKYPQYKSWWSYAHGGMYLGMAQMYWAHDQVIISPEVTSALTWSAGAFFVWFCSYYLYSLVAEMISTRGTPKWALYLQANISHLFGIGLPMLGMVLWPHIFMAMGDRHQHHHHSAATDVPDNPHEHHHHDHGREPDEATADPSPESKREGAR